MIDLLSIARTEASGGDLFREISSLFESTDVRPDGYPEAVVWKGGTVVLTKCNPPSCGSS